MSARTIDDSDAVPTAFDAGRLGRLAWLGLFIAALGWALLVTAAAVGDRLTARFGVMPHIHGDVIEIARCLIGSGFALAVTGALQTGFGALNRFFSAVLSRSTSRSAASEPAHAAPMHTTSMNATSMNAGPIHASHRAAPSTRAGRPYHILPDGSVEVETIVGTRRFGTMAEAREFI